MACNRIVILSIIFIFVCLQMQASFGGPLSRSRKHGSATRSDPDNKLERTAIRIMEALMRTESDPVIRHDILTFLRTLKLLRSKRDADVIFTKKYIHSLEQDAIKEFFEKTKEEAVEKTACEDEAMKYIGTSEFLEKITKCD